MPTPPRRPPPRTAPPTPRGPLARAGQYLGRRVDPLTSLFLVVPLFLIYHLGVLLQMRCGAEGCAWNGNGVDFLTSRVMLATHGSLAGYAGVMLAVALALVIAILWARRHARLHPRLFVPVLLESALYASLVGPTVVALQQTVGLGGRGGEGLFSAVISSCGAGLHEELVFRAGLFAGGAYLLRRLGVPALGAMAAAAMGSAVLFSAVHHLGALGEAFTFRAFAFRIIAGLVFTAVYQVRGFALAAWTHAIYDIWVLAILGN